MNDRWNDFSFYRSRQRRISLWLSIKSVTSTTDALCKFTQTHGNIRQFSLLKIVSYQSLPFSNWTTWALVSARCRWKNESLQRTKSNTEAFYWFFFLHDKVIFIFVSLLRTFRNSSWMAKSVCLCRSNRFCSSVVVVVFNT